MSFRSMTRYGSKFCSRSDAAVSSLFGIGGNGNRAIVVSSATMSFHKRSTHSTPSQMFRVEGVQGPIRAPLSLSESKQLLEKTVKQTSTGFAPQGVQGADLHTESHLQNSSKADSKFEWELEDTACPQGIQGGLDPNAGCGHFQTWLANCRRYGLANCDQQLQGIQTGRLTLAQVLAEQEALIAEIAESYHKRVQEAPQAQDESVQGAQGDMRLPDPTAPCPQGVQGDDCVRFKLWLENCHRFGLHECIEQLQGLQNGRISLAQIFIQQEEIIRKVVYQYQQHRSYSTQPQPQPRETSTDAMTTSQVGEAGAEQLSQREKLKRAVKEYGSTVIIFHITISLASLGGFYLAVSSGIDMVGILKSIGVEEAILQSKLATGTGTFVVAYAVHKVFAPVRIGITLTATPFIVRYLRRIGFLKPPQKVP